MARPPRANAEKTRNTLLEVASRLFSRRGVDGTSVRDIASAAGVTVGTVHHYFGSKDGLHRACVDAMYAELGTLRQELFAAVGGGGHPIEDLIPRAMRATFRFARRHQDAVRMLLREAVNAGEVPAERRDAWLIPFLDQGSELLAAALGCGVGHARASIQTLSHITTRYALTSERELALICGVESDGFEAIEQHLIDVARALLL